MTDLERIRETCRRAREHADRTLARRYGCDLPDGAPCPPKNETLGCARCDHRTEVTT